MTHPPKRAPFFRCTTLLAAALAVAAVPAMQAVAQYPALETYRIGLDIGNDPATGCPFGLGSLAPASLPGFELQVTVQVDASTRVPSVVSATLEHCAGSAFADPQPLGGFALELDSGVVHGGSTVPADAITGAIPYGLLGGATVARLAFHAMSSSGAEDALVTQDGSADGPPILARLWSPDIPALSPLGATLFAVVLAAAALLLRRRWAGAALVAVAAAAGWGAVAVAAWYPPLAYDPFDDATAPDTRAEIIDASAWRTRESTVELRLELSNVDVRASTFLSTPIVNRYFTVVPATGHIAATAELPFSWGEPLELRLDSGSSSYAIYSPGPGRYWRNDGGAVVADAMDMASAERWAIFIATSGSPPPGAMEVIILVDGPAGSSTWDAMRYDAASGELVVHTWSNLADLASDPASRFLLHTP